MPGIKVLETKNASATATIVTSTTVIGVVGSASLDSLSKEVKEKLSDKSQAGMLRFSNAEAALKEFEKAEGTIREDLYDIQAQNVKSPVIISLVEYKKEYKGKTPQSFYGDSKFKSAIVNAIGNLKKTRVVFSEKVRISIASYFSHDTTVRNALDSLAAATKTIAIVDMHESNVNDAIKHLKALGSQRYLAFPFYRKTWSVFENKSVLKPNSAIVAGHIAKEDAKIGEFGPCFDHANKLIYDVEGVAIPLTYEEGEDTCEVNTLVNAGGALLLNDDGNRLYNYESPSDDARFNKLETIRFFDLINENLQKSLKKHKHRPMTEVLVLAKADAEAFLNRAIRAGAAIGAKVWWSDKNSPEEIAAGNLYMDFDAGNNVGVRSIVIQPYATNDYYTLEVK
jgi:phage tail sheath protein FI